MFFRMNRLFSMAAAMVLALSPARAVSVSCVFVSMALRFSKKDATERSAETTATSRRICRRIRLPTRMPLIFDASFI